MDLDLFTTHPKLDLAVPLSVTATANRAGVDVSQFIGVAIVLLTALNTAGTTPTLDVKLQDSPDNTTFTDVPGAAFAQVTTGAGAIQSIGLNMDGVAKYLRVVDTLGGTSSPATTRSVILIGRKQVI
jgi:hypothetical protein